MPLGLAEAFATAMLTAQNASVAGAGAANASAVADVFVGGLQDAALTCTEEHRPAASPHTEAYFQCDPIFTSYLEGQTGLQVSNTACIAPPQQLMASTSVTHGWQCPGTLRPHAAQPSQSRCAT